VGGIDSDVVFGVLDASRGRFFGIPIVRGVVVQGREFYGDQSIGDRSR
jgi:hypothetical protein